MTAQTIDPIDLEVLRSRLETVGEQACRAVEQTAVSPIVTESKDYSVTLLDADGGLIIGSGVVIFHYGAAVHAVRSTIARHGDTVKPGDVFLSNDPHNGGGLHPQDVMVQQPIFHGDRLVCWVAVSAHLMDMGGMVVGSFCPEATECYQESFRVPPVRLFRAGEEVTDVWDLLRTNVRMSELVELDMRGLCAGAHFATARIQEVIEQTGEEMFVASLTAIRDLTEAEFRRRITRIADGTYKSTSWTEYHTEFYKIPCTLMVAGDELIFDFEGASPQCNRFFNSKPYIVAAELIVMIANLLAPDLPFNDGMFAPVTLKCPEGSVVNCKPPAPISASHMHISLNAAGVGMQALMLALAASPDSPQHQYLGGASWDSAITTVLWSWTTPAGVSDAFVAIDGLWVGGSAGALRDGNDLGRNTVGPHVEAMFPDIEVLESWFPLLFMERSSRGSGLGGGAGVHRAGGGNRFSFRPHGIGEISSMLAGMRRWLPLQGFAGGQPGDCNTFLIHRGDGSVEQLDVSSGGAKVGPQDWFEMRLGSGGGYGDPLDRDSPLVEADLDFGRIDEVIAREAYGVVAGDDAATERLRDEIRCDRLARAEPAAKPLARDEVSASGDALPLYPGVIQRGGVALAEVSGAPLALAPDHWTMGCPMLIERPWEAADAPDISYRSWLDPETGRLLHVEAIVDGDIDSFWVAPSRWVDASVPVLA